MKNFTLHPNHNTLTLIHDGGFGSIDTTTDEGLAILNTLRSEGTDAAYDMWLNTQIEDCVWGSISVKGGNVYHDNRIVSNVEIEWFLRLRSELGDEGMEPYARFLTKIQANPDNGSMSQVFDFIGNTRLSITPDGNLLAYKAVRSNFKDKYSGKIDNSVGQLVQMSRSQISSDRDMHCHYGLHAGSWEYAAEWFGSYGDRLIIVEIDPKDIVCVPNDHSFGKLRCCRYRVHQCAGIVGETLNLLSKALTR